MIKELRLYVSVDTLITVISLRCSSVVKICILLGKIDQMNNINYSRLVIPIIISIGGRGGALFQLVCVFRETHSIIQWFFQILCTFISVVKN